MRLEVSATTQAVYIGDGLEPGDISWEDLPKLAALLQRLSDEHLRTIGAQNGR